MFPTSNVRILPTKKENPMYQISVSYDENPVHWSKNYSDELENSQNL
jgi:hypothetical protein